MPKRNFFKKTQQQHYRSQRFQNPYFQNVTGTSRSFYYIMAAIFFVFIGMSLFIFTNTRFNIQHIKVTGTRHFSQDRVAEAIRNYLNQSTGFIFHPQNQFLFREDALKRQLESLFTFESITIQRNRDIVQIAVVEKQSQIIWESGSKWYVVDLDGKIIRELSQAEQQILSPDAPPDESAEALLLRELPVFIDRNSIEVVIGSEVLTSQELQNIFLFHKSVLSQNITIKNTQIDRVAGKWIGLETGDGYEILFDATGDVKAQASRLETIMKEKVKDISELEYIDLRFGDRVYFK